MDTGAEPAGTIRRRGRSTPRLHHFGAAKGHVMLHFRAHQPALVVLVEDDAVLRMAAAADLVEAGFGVLEAAGEEPAMAALAALGGQAVLVTDLDLGPGGDGCHLARRARAAWPELPVVVATGRIADPSWRGWADIWVPKPYGPAALAGAVCGLLLAS